jgi:hypothetical protein
MPVMEKIEDHFQVETYGAVLKFTPDVVMLYGQILMMIVGGDGVVSKTEWDYLSGRAKAMGIPQDVIDAWHDFDYKNGDLAGSVRAFYGKLGATAYAFLYDAVKVARADGYVEGERKALRRAAKAADIPESVVAQIENLVEAEEALRTLRISLLYPESSIFHGKKASKKNDRKN